MKKSYYVLFYFLITILYPQSLLAQQAEWPTKTTYHFQEVNGNKIFYRQAGVKSVKKPTLVLLHGYPTTSHYYRELIPLLSGRYHIIAPDNLGSGYSAHPSPHEVTYTFDLLADHLQGLLNALEIDKYVFYVHDFGAPVGFLTMMREPEKLKGLITQNGNAYVEGLSADAAEFFPSAQADTSPKMIEKIDNFSLPSGISYGYLSDVKGRTQIMSPDSWTHDGAFFTEEESRRIQTHLFQDYNNNLINYPKWQKFLRQYKPEILSIWGKLDQFFILPGGEAFKRDVPKTKIHTLDAGHFAVEEKPVEIAKQIIKFMDKLKR